MSTYAAAVVRCGISVAAEADTVGAARAANIARIRSTLSALGATSSPPSLIVLPVLAISGGSSGQGVSPAHTAIDLSSDVLAPLIDDCARHRCYLATSVVEKSPRFPNLLFHTGIILGPEGVVLRAPKAQAHSAPSVTILRDIQAAYIAAYGPDSIFPVVKTSIGTLGCLVESEIQAPEAARVLASKGAQVIVHPTYEGVATPPWPALKCSAAYINGVYLLSASTAGQIAEPPEQKPFIRRDGSATIISPAGAMIASISGCAEGYATAEINLAEQARIQSANARHTAPAKVLYRHLYEIEE